GAAAPDDALYEAVSEGRRHAGMEHWLPLFHRRLDTLFDYLPASPIATEPLAEEAAHERLDQIADYYQARQDALTQSAGGAPYKPLPPDRLYLAETEWRERMAHSPLARMTPFTAPFTAPEPGGAAADNIIQTGVHAGEILQTGVHAGEVMHVGARPGHNFATERSTPSANVFEAVVKHVGARQSDGKGALIALWSEGSRERMGHVLAEHGLHNLAPVASWPQALALPRPQVGLAVLGLESGFETADVALITEQDILGERLIRARRPSKRAENFIAEVTGLAAGDLVVHVDHGIGRFSGLRAIEAAGAPHDCLEIHYAGGDKLFLPVENIELLSRYGSDQAGAELDRLGGSAWQGRKARM